MSARCRPARWSLALWTGAILSAGCLPPSIAANIMLRPAHTRVEHQPALEHVELEIPGDGVELKGWFFPAENPRGTVVYLHGRNQNRGAAIPIAEHLVPLGYDVLAYDSRAHGESGGRYSTFGYWEKKDLSRAIDFIGAREVIVIGTSLGAASALQAAADDERIVGVVAVSAFSSMEQVVRDRLPGIVPEGQIEAAFRAAERRAHMEVSDANAEAAARRIHAPVLLMHGDGDRFTRAVHARRIFEALSGPKELVFVPGAGHGNVLARPEAWASLTAWLRRQTAWSLPFGR